MRSEGRFQTNTGTTAHKIKVNFINDDQVTDQLASSSLLFWYKQGPSAKEVATPWRKNKKSPFFITGKKNGRLVSWCVNVSRPSMVTNISGWWFQPLWKIWKSVGSIIPNIWETCSKPPTRYVWLMSHFDLTFPNVHSQNFADPNSSPICCWSNCLSLLISWQVTISNHWPNTIYGKQTKMPRDKT